MCLFLYGNSAEMRETEGKIMYSNIFIYVSLMETEHGKMAANKNLSLKYLGGIIFHGLEYLIRHEVVFCFIF